MSWLSKKFKQATSSVKTNVNITVPKLPKSVVDISSGFNTNINSITSSTKTNLAYAKDIIKKGPKGTLGHWVDQIYGSDTKKAVGSIQQTYKDFEDVITSNQPSDDVTAAITSASNEAVVPGYGNGNGNGDVNGNGDGIDDNNISRSIYGSLRSSTRGGGYNIKKKKEQSRGQMNLTRSIGRSILTS